MPSCKPQLETIHRSPLPVRAGRGLLRLDLNESPDGLPEEIIRKALDGVDAQFLATYPEYLALERRIAANLGVSPASIALGNGSDGVIKHLFDAYLGQGDVLVLTDPSFAMYEIYARAQDARVDWVPYTTSFAFPVAAFIDRICAGARMAALVNPNNPMGTALEREELLSIIQACRSGDVLLLVDEAYFHFFGQTAVDLVARYDNLVVLRTFSKLCGMASARLGFACAAAQVVENVRKVRPTYDINGLAVRLGLALLEAPGLVARLVAEALEGKAFLVDSLARAGIEHRAGEGNFVLVRCPGRVDEVVSGLAEREVLVKGGFALPMLRDFVRVTVGRRSSMERFWKAFQQVHRGAGASGCARTG